MQLTLKPGASVSEVVRTHGVNAGANVSATHMSVIDMIKFAYGVKSDEQLEDAPGWLRTAHFDIQWKGSEADNATVRELGFEKGTDVARFILSPLGETIRA